MKGMGLLNEVPREDDWDTPPKINMEPQNCWFVDAFPFPMGHFQVPC